MQNLFGILNSQSRYELQQELLINPNGLVINTVNRFGVVDSSNRISNIKSLQHNIRQSFSQSNISFQPLLAADHFGIGLNAFDMRSNKKLLSNGESLFKPNWNDECFVAFKMKINQNTGFPQIYTISKLGEDISAGFLVAMNAGKVFMSFTNNDNTKQHRITTNSQYGDNVEYDVIAYNSGTNDMSQSKIYINEAEVATTVIDDDMTGVDIFPGTGWLAYIASRRTNTALNFEGFLGKIISGYGTPNVELLTKALNAKTF